MKLAVRDTEHPLGTLGGAVVACIELSEALRNLVGQVDVYTASPHSYPNCRTLPVSSLHSRSRFVRTCKKLSRELHPETLDRPYDGVIFPNQLEPSVRTPQSKRVRIVYDIIPLLFPRQFPLLALYYRIGFRRVLENADKVVVPSQRTKDDLLDHFRLPAARIQVIRTGFNRRLVDGASGWEAAPLPFRDCLLYIGTLLPHKNLHRLIQALALVRRRLPVQLVVAGAIHPRYFRSLWGKVERSGLSRSVHVLGTLSDQRLAGLLRSARALIMPSVYEGIGLPPLEAMASGIPVAASRAPGLSETCGDAAVQFDPLDVDDIAAAMEKVLTDEDIRSRCVRIGFEQVKKFDWDVAAREHVEMIAAL